MVLAKNPPPAGEKRLFKGHCFIIVAGKGIIEVQETLRNFREVRMNLNNQTMI